MAKALALKGRFRGGSLVHLFLHLLLTLDGFLCQLSKRLSHILIISRRSLNPLDVPSKLLHYPLSSLLVNGPLILKVTFISDHEEWKGVGVDDHTFLDERVLPLFEVFQRLGIRDVIYEEAAVGSPVESRAQGLVSLLASRVPNLKHDDSSVESDFLIAEVSADCGLEVVSEARVLKHLDKRSLADARVSDGDDLDEALLLAPLEPR